MNGEVLDFGEQLDAECGTGSMPEISMRRLSTAWARFSQGLVDRGCDVLRRLKIGIAQQEADGLGAFETQRSSRSTMPPPEMIPEVGVFTCFELLRAPTA